MEQVIRTHQRRHIQHICITSNFFSQIHKYSCWKSYKLMSLTSFLSGLWKLSFTEAQTWHALICTTDILRVSLWYLNTYLHSFHAYCVTYLSPQSFFVASSTFFEHSTEGSCAFSPLAANLVTYISANCFRVNAQPCRPEPNPTVPITGSIFKRGKKSECISQNTVLKWCIAFNDR